MAADLKRRLLCVALFAVSIAHADIVTLVAITQSPINLAAIPSRQSGTAPLAVSFDASNTTDASVTSTPFHNLQYSWNFGDSACTATQGTVAGTWDYGAGAGVNSRNTATGPVAAHVFECAGTFTVTVTMYDGTSTATQTIPITVTAQDASYPTTATICFSNASSFTGCPAGATQAGSSSDFDAAVNSLSANQRALFERGGAWTASEPAILNKNGLVLGAYGSGDKPAITRTGGAQIIQPGSAGNTFTGGTVMDLDLSGDADCVVGKGTFNQLLFLRVDCHDVTYGFNFSITTPSLAKVWNELFIVDSTVQNVSGASGNGVFIVWTNAALMGSYIYNSTGVAPDDAEHNVRSMHSNKVVYSNNTMEKPNATKGNFILRAVPWDCVGNCGPLPLQTYTQYVVVSDNKFIGATGVTVPVNTSIDSGSDARTRNLIFERNWWAGQTAALTAMSLNSDLTTIRNNVFDLSDSSSTGQNAIGVTANGNAQPDPGVNGVNWIYNNTAYSSGAPTNFRIVNLAVSANNTVVKNNLGYAPSATNKIGVADLGVNTTASNNSATEPAANGVGDDPLFTSVSPFTPMNAKPTVGSYAIDGGTSVPVWSDFGLNAITGTREIGAWQF